jgi:hypothetical protein
MLSGRTVEDGVCVCIYTLLNNASMLVYDYHCQTLGIIVFTDSAIKYTERPFIDVTLL